MKMEDYFQLDVIIEQTLHKKRSFRLRISSVDVTKPTITANLVKSLMQNVIFCVVRIINSGKTLSKLFCLSEAIMAKTSTKSSSIRRIQISLAILQNL